ncbi:MAG: polyprenyl diphosphate synthase [Gammaproteobacteria bacterium]
MKIPRHIAITMDGNGRWAKQRFLPRLVGHTYGSRNARQVLDLCLKKGVEVLTLFAFGCENWRRPETEVGHLMKLLAFSVEHEIKDMNKKGIRLRVIGDIDALEESLQKKINRACEMTADNSAMTLVIALNYSGQWDICQAAKTLAQKVKNDEMALEEITPETFSSALVTHGLPDPDLAIRTSGESRISNFLLWQFAYTELYFTPVHWPDFDEKALSEALEWYGQRERRFGYTSEQVV